MVKTEDFYEDIKKFTLALKVVLTFVSNTHDNHKAIVPISK